MTCDLKWHGTYIFTNLFYKCNFFFISSAHPINTTILKSIRPNLWPLHWGHYIVLQTPKKFDVSIVSQQAVVCISVYKRPFTDQSLPYSSGGIARGVNSGTIILLVEQKCVIRNRPIRRDLVWRLERQYQL